MSQINLNANPVVINADIQDHGNVRGAGGQPRADLPPELQNARPAKSGIFARIGAFLFGAGAAGGASAVFGGGTLLSGVLGAGTTAALGGFAVASIATGGAALLGGLAGIGIFAGIRAIVNHFRRAPDPAPRLQNQPQGNLPNAAPAADAFNKNIGDIIKSGKGELPASLKHAADNTVARMRDLYGEAAVPQGKALRYLLDMHKDDCVQEIRQLGEAVSPAQLERILEKHLRMSMAKAVVENAFKPFCGEDGILPVKLRIHLLMKHPAISESLENAASPEQVREILAGAEDKINDMARLHERMKNLSVQKRTMDKMISIIGRSLGLDAAVVAPHVYAFNCTSQVEELESKIMSGKLDANDLERQFDRLAENLAKQYVDSFAAVDAVGWLSEETKTILKMDILTSKDLPDPELVRKGLAAGYGVNAGQLKAALDTGLPKEMIIASLTALGAQANAALREQFDQAAWAQFTRKNPSGLRYIQGVAVMAAIDKVPGLKEALSARQDINIMEENFRMRADPHASLEEQGGIAASAAGVVRLREAAQYNADFQAMQAQTPVLNVFRDADVPQDLKARWIEKTMRGEISSPAMARALVENVPGLSAETRPLMEKFILMQPYDPDHAEDSAGKARAQAQEMAGWRNFDTTVDLEMTPVAGMVKDDISASLTQGQQYDRGISRQMKMDAHRGVYTINGEVMDRSDGETVARALNRAMPTEKAAELVSSIVNQRTFGPLNGLGMQVNPTTGEPLPQDLLANMTKMATRNIANGGLLHYDLSSSQQGDVAYTVTVLNGRAVIEASESVGLNSGLNNGGDGFAKLFGKARFTIRFECDLLGQDGQSPRIETVHISQQLLPVE
ncbi:MAG: hypothetical protein J6I40_08020 [Mailhella sp.]|nr:hypothetical protein [Mailhella sp.]